jgi:hypothetical protein
MHEGGSEAPCPLFSFAFYLLFLLSFVRGGDFDTLSARWDWKDIQIRELTGAQDREGGLTRRGVWASRQALYPAHGINPLSICDFAMPFDARLVVILEISHSGDVVD